MHERTVVLFGEIGSYRAMFTEYGKVMEKICATKAPHFFSEHEKSHQAPPTNLSLVLHLTDVLLPGLKTETSIHHLSHIRVL